MFLLLCDPKALHLVQRRRLGASQTLQGPGGPGLASASGDPLWGLRRPGLGCRLPTVPQRSSVEKATRAACVHERVDCGTGTVQKGGRAGLGSRSCAVPTLRDTQKPSQHHLALPALGGRHLCAGCSAGACVCAGVRARVRRMQALRSKALPSRPGEGRAPRLQGGWKRCHCVLVRGGGRAGGRLGRVSVCLSLCGGGCAGAEGCGMHQNMCVPAARWLGGGGRKVCPLPCSCHPPPSLEDLPPPQHPILGLWPLPRIWSPALALTQPFPMA